MEQFFAHVAAACEADAFLFDSFSNPSAQQIEERLEPFVATIRAAHPTTPLIFLQTEVRESRNFNDKIRKFRWATTTMRPSTAYIPPIWVTAVFWK